MNPITSNISVVSNIYPVKTARTIRLPGLPERVTGVVDDHAFRLKIKCRKALVTVSELTHGATISDQHRVAILLDHHLVSEAQIKAYWDKGRCVDCLSGERPIGLVRDGGTTSLECRCEKRNCPVREST